MCLKDYGAQIRGRIFGGLFSVHQVFVFATIWLGGVSYDVTGSYQWITYFTIGLSCLSVAIGLLLWGVKPHHDDGSAVMAKRGALLSFLFQAVRRAFASGNPA